MELKINYAYTVGYVIMACIGLLNLGYCYAYFNTCTKIMHDQYVHYGKFVIEDRALFNSVISALIPSGAIFGAPLGGVLAAKGRRSALLKIATIFTIGCFMTTYFNFYALFFGRLIMGTCIGSYVTVVPCLVSEISPKSIAGPLGVINQLMCVTGILIACTLGFIVPYASTEEAMTTEVWKYIFGLPAGFTMFQIFCLLFIFTYDSPKFYEMQNDSEGYKKSMNKLYHNAPLLDTTDGLLDDETVTAPEKTCEPTWSELYAYPNRKPLIIGILIGIFHQTTGISSVTFFSNEIFSKGHTGTGAELAARLGTFGTGVAGVLSVITAIFLTKHYGRKTMLLGGEICMTVLLAFLTNCAINNKQIGTLIGTVLFVYVFNGTFGSLLWLYISEILTAKGISIVAFVNLIFTVIFGCLGNIIFEILKPAGVYLSLFFIQIICIFFLYQYVIETKGKSKKE